MKKTGVVISVLTIQGLVQGVGFRPFIYRIADEMGGLRRGGQPEQRGLHLCRPDSPPA